MTKEVVVRTSTEKIEQLLEDEIDELKLEVYESGLRPIPLAEVEYDMVCDIAGIIREVSDINHFTRSDGDEGQVRNIRIQDSTADIRIALWGDHADHEFELGTPVVCENVEIQDGWQDEIEASCGWNSTIERLEEPDIEFVTVQLHDEEGDEE